MSEISKYDAQKKKLDGLCEEHDLTFRLRHDRYPITLTIKPLTGMDQQIDMLADAENKDYISQDASMVIYRKDGELATRSPAPSPSANLSGTSSRTSTSRFQISGCSISSGTSWRRICSPSRRSQ